MLSSSIQPADDNTFATIAQWLQRIPSDDNNNHLGCETEGAEAGAGLPELSDLVEELSQMEEVLAELEMKTVRCGWVMLISIVGSGEQYL